MHYTIEMLIQGRGEIIAFYHAAADHWRAIWDREDAANLEMLARMLPTEQMWFEKNCGGRWVGQEIMVVSGFALHYSTEGGFVENGYERARLLYDAIQSSLCSVEVKVIAEDVAESYDLIESTSY
ncbi:MAG TPA: hypothetical protein VGN42_08095 [Pirellulales bacterium]|nr:hypothetical protein [Pirellulales bacterium]